MKKTTLILFLIILLSIFLRVIKLDTAPPELFGDELDVGYQAYSLLKTGQDIQGHFLPVYIQSLAEYRAPLFIYSAIPFIKIFGLNEWGVRLTAAFWGVLGIIALYFLTKKLFKNDWIAVIAAFLLAISPWHLQYSRAGFEVTLLLFLLLTASWLFLKGLERPRYLILSAVLFAFTPYTYSTAALFMPLFLLSLVIIFRNDLKNLIRKTTFKIAALVFVIVLLPFGWQFMFGQTTTRFSQINVAVNPEITKNINLERQIDRNLGFLFHNKPLSFIFEASRNYLWASSPQFLFTDGDPIGRHSVGQMGELYWFMLPLLLIGVFVLLTNKKIIPQNKFLLFSWLLLAPLPASLTYDGAGHATRLILLLPPLILISSIGTIWFFQNILRIKLRVILVVIFLILSAFNIVSYFHRYYVDYPVESWRWWQTGYKAAFSYIKDNQENYDKIVINNTYEPSLIRFLFYMQYDPKIFHQRFTVDKPQKGILPGIDGFKLDKFYFGTLSVENKGVDELAKVLDSKTLYLASQRDEIVGGLDLRYNPPDNVKVLKTVTDPFDKPIFYILTSNKINMPSI